MMGQVVFQQDKPGRETSETDREELHVEPR